MEFEEFDDMDFLEQEDNLEEFLLDLKDVFRKHNVRLMARDLFKEEGSEYIKTDVFFSLNGEPVTSFTLHDALSDIMFDLDEE